MNNTTTETGSILSQRLIAGGSYFLLSFTGVLLYVALFCGMFPNRKYYRKNAFYFLVVYLGAADIGIFVAQLLVAVPYSFAGQQLYPPLMTAILSSIDSVAFMAVLYLSCFMTCNRFAVFCAPRLNAFLVEKVHHIAFLCWLSSLLWVPIQEVAGCSKTFDYEGFYFKHDCKVPLEEVPMSWQYVCRWIKVQESYYLPVIGFFMYLFVFMYMKWMKHAYSMQNTQTSSSERKMLIQGAIINLSLLIEVIMFSMPTYENFNPPAWGISWYAVSLLLSWSVIVNSMVTPVILFVFNTTVRHDLLIFFHLKKVPTRGISMSSMATIRTRFAVRRATIASTPDPDPIQVTAIG